jgi:hypothetical protein
MPETSLPLLPARRTEAGGGHGLGMTERKALAPLGRPKTKPTMGGRAQLGPLGAGQVTVVAVWRGAGFGIDSRGRSM